MIYGIVLFLTALAWFGGMIMSTIRTRRAIIQHDADFADGVSRAQAARAVAEADEAAERARRDYEEGK